jgi:hypothetical protein
VYDGSADFSNVSLSGVNGETFIVGTATSNSKNVLGASNFSSYSGDITGNGGALTSNYNALDLGALTSNIATITPATYQSMIGSKVYDGNATFSSVTLTGVNGETFIVGNATANSANVVEASRFTNATGISANGGALTSNYNAIDFEALRSNTATITPAPLTITANNDSKNYDGVGYSGGNGVSYSGFVNNESVDVLGGLLTYAGTSQGAVNAGTYGIDPSGLTSSNYAISYSNGELTINPPVSEPKQIPVDAPVQTGNQSLQGSVPGAVFTLIDINGAVLPSAVSIQVNVNPNGTGGSIDVSVPSDQGQLTGSFVLSLPSDVLDATAPVTITLENGSPLPSWITYDAATHSLTANNVPAGTTTVNIVISQGAKTWTMHVSAVSVTQ